MRIILTSSACCIIPHNRQELKCGSVISHKGIAFEITGLLGRGGNAIAYTAQYSDSVIEGGVHQCFDNVGITHASVWEASRIICGDTAGEWLDNDALAKEEEKYRGFTRCEQVFK
ncbi:MAG: hypothetical protein ACI4DP_00060 [Candidatus Ornithomonoglobus sp.]